MRLIDADALLDAMRDEEFQTFVPLDEIDSVIDKAPTIDAVPVVRCKDCKHRHSSEFCECRPDDAFCSDGAKMDGGAEGCTN